MHNDSLCIAETWQIFYHFMLLFTGNAPSLQIPQKNKDDTGQTATPVFIACTTAACNKNH